MKKVLFLACAFLLVGGSAAAADSSASVDLSASFATAPQSFFDDGWGVDVGGNVDFDRLGIKVNLPQNMKVQARASLGYYKWSRDFEGTDFTYRRIPLDVGGRFVYTINPMLKAHGDLAVEVSFDKGEAFGYSETETNVGLVPGVGITYFASDVVTLGADVRYHVITDRYVSLGVNVGFNIP